MSKVLRIEKGGYKVITEYGSEIRLDTGGAGQVTILGNLFVEGATTQLEVTNTTIQDNLIEINRGGGSPDGIAHPDGIAGLLIDRGETSENPDVYFIYDEALSYTKPDDAVPTQGSFVLRDANGSLVGLTTTVINNPYTSINFELGNEGVLAVKVPGNSEPYHSRIGLNEHIPNIRYLKDYVRAEAGQAVIEKFYRYADTEAGFVNTLTGAEALDNIAGDGQFSGVLFSVGSGSIDYRIQNRVALMNRNGLFVGNPYNPDGYHLKLYTGTTDYGAGITTDNTDLVIAPDTGVVKLKTQLHIENFVGNDPNNIADTNIIYSKEDQGAGGTGLYFVNDTTAGELCSAAKALVYGLIF